MNRLGRMLPRIARLQTRIVILFGLLMVVVQIVGLVLLNTVGTSNARRSIDDELTTGARLFTQLVELRNAQLAQGARVLASDYAFREALATHDDRTIVSALSNHGARIHAQVMMLVGLDRRIVADSAQASAAGKPFPIPGLIETAEKKRKTASTVMLDGKLYQVAVVPVAVPLPVGWVVMGFAIDDDAAKELQRITDLDVTFLGRRSSGDWTLQASTAPAARQAAIAAAMRQGGLEESLTSLVGGDEVTKVSRLDAAGDQAVVAVLQVPLDKALGPFRRLMHELVALALVGLLVSTLWSIVIARGIAKPVGQLATFARRIAGGDYSDPPRIARVDEIGDLSAAFDHMREGIEAREQRILHLAYRDGLTGLPNRALFSDRLRQAVASSRRAGAPMCVLLLDLDRFKYVNDSLGHRIGDVLLCEVAKRLTDTMARESDTVARLGGDEFAVLLSNTDIDGGRRVVQKILRALEQPMQLDGHIVDAHASIGVACFPEHGDDLEGLLRRADIAMYLAKRNSAGYAVYDVMDDQHSAERLSLMSQLRTAVEHDQLVLHYQPKVDLTNDATESVEALVRWNHPQRGFVPPVDFIPFAEQTGYIRAITMWVLDRATAQCAAWHREGLPIHVSINISARDLLNAELPLRFAEMLERHACPADAICLEITESAILEDTAHAFANLDRLSALGCELSIDDYGTGYSSLSYLKKLPVDELKIDRSFVKNMLNDRDDRVIVQSTIDLAHNMGLVVTAEGVEDQPTLDRLRAMGCDRAQGFLMSRPIPAEDVARRLREARRVVDEQALRLVG